MESFKDWVYSLITSEINENEKPLLETENDIYEESDLSLGSNVPQKLESEKMQPAPARFVPDFIPENKIKMFGDVFKSISSEMIENRLHNLKKTRPVKLRWESSTVKIDIANSAKRMNEIRWQNANGIPKAPKQPSFVYTQ